MPENLSSAAVVIGALRVNVLCHLLIFFKIIFSGILSESNSLDPDKN